MSNSAVSFCLRCGSELPPTAYSFCPTCGADVFQKNRGKLRLSHNSRGDTLKAIAQSSGRAPLDFIKNTAAGMDDGIDKIPIKSILKKITESTDDPRVKNIAKSLARHSPKIAMAIASGVLTSYGIPPGVILTPLAAAAAKHTQKKSERDSDASLSGDLDYSEYVPIMAQVIEKIAEHQKMRPR